MNDWIYWMIATGILIALEMFTGTFYLLMIALGLATGSLAAFAGADQGMQLVGAAVVGILATYALRRNRLGKAPRLDAARDPNVNLDIGQTLMINNWQSHGGAYTARVFYRGADWDVELQHGATPTSGPFEIREIRGSRLIVANSGKK